MTLRKRFTLFTIFWFIFILILFNIFVYFFVIRISTNSEEQLIANKVNLIVEHIRSDPERPLKDPELLVDFYNVNELIRIIDRDGNIVNQVGTDEDLLERESTFSATHQSGLTSIRGMRVLYMKVPLFREYELVGTLEVLRKLTALDRYLQVLVGALTVTSIGAVLFAIFGTYWFTLRLTAPIQTMVQTMREIERSGKLQPIELKDREESAELQQLIRAFNQMIERLDRRMEGQRQFVADASHELKTPLTVIRSYADMLKRWGREDSAIRDEAIEAIAKESERMQNLIKSMLTLTEAEQELWMKEDTFDLVQLIDEIASMLQKTFNRIIRVHAYDESGIPMKGDRDKISQLMVILIDNAIKYSKDAIDITVSQSRHMIRVLVSDKGIGIPEDEIPNLFDRFYRVDGARQRETGGFGLGLAIAKRIVDLHEGTIDIFSKVGVGTTVALQFPKK
ncbi:MAG: two-component sensor histidine kinase [Thermobacillus sp. ZCTH02-B1]|uniref:sensor histidine kinase n=1 Tax=Thermobacillus sp. ZCTH02-B1 TaxID=1858795 RepID=UPI000B55F40D|nr:HAMP domain-containing histidine kinase [Thermobacillus sp. ZCTH02-B1]OUM96680.1 MAG: two-component sensor histidine kinase [Thermobacillus sp. ZCTH02-B1]